MVRYLARRLYLSDSEFLSMYVVEVCNNEVVALYPFEKELQSMLLVDALVLSMSANEVVPVSNENFNIQKLPHPCFVIEGNVVKNSWYFY